VNRADKDAVDAQIRTDLSLSGPANVLDHYIPMNCAIRAGLPF
jgi:hypothetical protein